MARAIVDARDALRHFTITAEIRHMREVRLRIWLAVRLLRLACWIANFGLSEKHQIGVIVSMGGEADEPNLYRKRPVVIEAIQWTGDNFAEIAKLGDNVFGPYGTTEPYLEIETREGRMRANLRWWIIKGVAGELHPCDPDIFAATYDLA